MQTLFKKDIAIDFDGTIFKKVKFPEIGEPVMFAIECIKELKSKGHNLFLWTCRKDKALDMAISKLAEHGIVFDVINEHPDQTHLSNKLDADLFIDDKALGCPLKFYLDEKGKGRTCVEWGSVRQHLQLNGYV